MALFTFKTGLILGYSIEATIKLYRENWRHCTKKNLTLPLKREGWELHPHRLD